MLDLKHLTKVIIFMSNKFNQYISAHFSNPYLLCELNFILLAVCVTKEVEVTKVILLSNKAN